MTTARIRNLTTGEQLEITGHIAATEYIEVSTAFGDKRYIRHTKGRWAGLPLVYEPWQREFWWEALEFDPATGLRIYNEVACCAIAFVSIATPNSFRPLSDPAAPFWRAVKTSS